MSDGQRKDVTDRKHVFQDPRHYELVKAARSAGSPSSPPTSPKQREKSDDPYKPGRRRLGSLANVFKKGKKNQPGENPTNDQRTQRPETREKRGERPLSWSDWFEPGSPQLSQSHRGSHQSQRGKHNEDPYYTSDDDVRRGAEQGPVDDEDRRQTPLLPPVAQPVAHHTPSTYLREVNAAHQQVYGDDDWI